jgi:Bardet-Biedl syndrome 4 protein
MESDHLFHLNYAVTLYNNDRMDQAAEQLRAFESIYLAMDDDQRRADADVAAQYGQLKDALQQFS